MISPRSLFFAAFVAMFALSMAAPAAEAEAEAKPVYYYGGQQNGPHHTYYRGYNTPTGQHYRGQGYNFNGYNGYNQYNGYNGFNNGFNNGFSNGFFNGFNNGFNRFQAQGW